MKEIRSWMIFGFLCVASVMAVFWLEEGTNAGILGALTKLTKSYGTPGTYASENPPQELTSDTPLSISESATNHASKRDRPWQAHSRGDQFVCNRPPTKSRSDVKRNLVYSWIDENGQTHMSDSPPKDHIASVTDLSDSKQEFTYTVNDDGANLPVAFQGKLSAGAKRIYDTWNFFLGEEKLRQTHITVRVIGGPARFDAFRKEVWPNSLPAGGFYSPSKNVAYVKYDPKRPENAIRTTFHEVSHLITAGHLGSTPPWLTEGLAEYFETMEVSHQGGTIYPNEAHIRLLQRNPIPRLDSFLSVTRSQWNGEMREMNYAVAWSLMHFLMQGPPGVYAMKEVVEQAHTNLCKPFATKKALHEAYQGGLQRLEADWRQWMAMRGFGIQQI
ncbi:DUF1570 domain-containing protein [Pseudohalioglobus lutimaris]|uniref:DUF1570 domain-containing protein n=1 Tax=Pseudohalioglobus lutimaris TaxID=1737061 RepID=A0A2N5X7T6_9GAMM|nr:DUF1570 domain-containing protein [Pseudohalioglobus lutimaris]PLW70553.1 hypothetical protein C0039_00005 [Pseudohalioglobus lutimaris]